MEELDILLETVVYSAQVQGWHCFEIGIWKHSWYVGRIGCRVLIP